MLADLKLAGRQAIKSPGFVLVAVLTLALGIGACTAIFSVVNGVLLRPLDYPEPERLMVMRESQLPAYPEFSVSPPDYLDWTRQLKSFENLAAFTGAPLNLTGEGEPQRLVGMKVTANYFATYGITPALGRVFSTEEDAPGKSKVAVVSEAFWQRVLGGDKNALEAVKKVWTTETVDDLADGWKRRKSRTRAV